MTRRRCNRERFCLCIACVYANLSYCQPMFRVRFPVQLLRQTGFQAQRPWWRRRMRREVQQLEARAEQGRCSRAQHRREGYHKLASMLASCRCRVASRQAASASWLSPMPSTAWLAVAVLNRSTTLDRSPKGNRRPQLAPSQRSNPHWPELDAPLPCTTISNSPFKADKVANAQSSRRTSTQRHITQVSRNEFDMTPSRRSNRS